MPLQLPRLYYGLQLLHVLSEGPFVTDGNITIDELEERV